jgi:hypothetical protein
MPGKAGRVPRAVNRARSPLRASFSFVHEHGHARQSRACSARSEPRPLAPPGEFQFCPRARTCPAKPGVFRAQCTPPRRRPPLERGPPRRPTRADRGSLARPLARSPDRPLARAHPHFPAPRHECRGTPNPHPHEKPDGRRARVGNRILSAPIGHGHGHGHGARGTRPPPGTRLRTRARALPAPSPTSMGPHLARQAAPRARSARPVLPRPQPRVPSAARSPLRTRRPVSGATKAREPRASARGPHRRPLAAQYGGVTPPSVRGPFGHELPSYW